MVPNFDYLIIFEDDAVPFRGITWPTTEANDLDLRLDRLEKEEIMALVLGGHSFRSCADADPKEESALSNGMTQISHFQGFYGVVLPRRTVAGRSESGAIGNME